MRRRDRSRPQPCAAETAAGQDPFTAETAAGCNPSAAETATGRDPCAAESRCYASRSGYLGSCLQSSVIEVRAALQRASTEEPTGAAETDSTVQADSVAGEAEDEAVGAAGRSPPLQKLKKFF